MNYLCVFDMDGTLLGADQLVSAKNREALEKLRAEGVGVVLATGRTELMTRQYRKDLGISLPVISNNGALVVDAKTGDVLYRRVFSRTTLEKILEYVVAGRKDYFIYTVDTVYFSENSRKIRIVHQYNGMVPESERITPQILPWDVPAVLSMLPDGGEDCALKVLLSYHTPEDCAFFETLEGVAAATSQGDAHDIMPAGADKGAALAFLAERLNILPQNIFAFGDNCNDLTMLEYAGYAIAPANAVDEVKRIADFIARSNNESGVAQAVDEFVIPKIRAISQARGVAAP